MTKAPVDIDSIERLDDLIPRAGKMRCLNLTVEDSNGQKYKIQADKAGGIEAFRVEK